MKSMLIQQLFIQQSFFNHMAFVTNVFTSIFVVLGIIIWLVNDKLRSSSFSWVQLVYSFGLIVLGVFLVQHQIRHYIGATFVFLIALAGFNSSIKNLFSKTN